MSRIIYDKKTSLQMAPNLVAKLISEYPAQKHCLNKCGGQ